MPELFKQAEIVNGSVCTIPADSGNTTTAPPPAMDKAYRYFNILMFCYFRPDMIMWILFELFIPHVKLVHLLLFYLGGNESQRAVSLISTLYKGIVFLSSIKSNLHNKLPL